MKPTRLLAALAMIFLVSANAQELPRRTIIDDYVKSQDDAYAWRIVATHEGDGIATIVVSMVSQHWLTPAEVDRSEWQHWLTLTIPDAVVSDIGMLYIGGGSNGGEPPAQSSERMAAIARATGSVVAELGMVPNQPLIFHGDGQPRYEDDLIAYAWDQFIQTGEARWLPRNAMVKSAVRAMDTVSAVMASEHGGERNVDRFVVAGGSKRGWTTWLTGAMDERVVAIIPVVIDVLNVDPSMRHHFAAYGFWAPSVGDYVNHRIMERFDHPRLAEVYRLVDPYYYRHRLTMPKLVLNASGDQFFLPDSSQFYWPELRGENYLRYVPNADHSLQGTDAVDSIVAFHSLILRGRKPPQFSWTHSADGTLRVLTVDEPPAVRLWQSTNVHARDFRIKAGQRYTDTLLQPAEPGLYVARVAAPETGWTAWFLELAYDVGAARPLKLSTAVAVTPNTLPFADKPPSLPFSMTVICRAEEMSVQQADAVGQAAEEALVTNALAEAVNTQAASGRLIVNWTPAGNARESFAALTALLRERQCADLALQLESGPGATLPPVSPGS